MEIYKLGDISKIISGSKVENNKIGEVPIVGSGGIFGYTNKSKYKKESISLPRIGTMEIFWYDFPVWNVNTCFLVGDINKKIIFKKYLFYILLNKKKWSVIINGSTIPATKISDWEKLKIQLPSLKKQKEIIDIIEQNEKLFLKYFSCIRIDNLENAKKDMKKLIDIIEPVENIINKCKKLIKKIKIILIKEYKSISNNNFSFNKIIKILNKKWNNQENYFATNAFKELEIDFSKKINIIKNRPLRANLQPQDNSCILSKLDGENKIYHFNNKPNFVVSTGFYNFQTDYKDHVLGFLLSLNFKKQKTKYSIGTTMKAINNNSLKNIQIKKPENNKRIFWDILIKINDILNESKKIQKSLIKSLIK